MRLNFTQLYNLLLLLSTGFVSCTNVCSNFIIPKTANQYSCSSQTSFNAATLKIPSPYKQLVVTFTVVINDFCPSVSTVANLMTVQIKLPNGAYKKVLFIIYDTANGYLSLFSETSTTLATAFSFQPSAFKNNIFSFYAAIDLDKPYFAGTAIADAGYYESETSSVSYGSDWVFDQNTVLTLCSDVGGVSPVMCEAQNLKIAYNMPADPSEVLLANSDSMIGDFKLSEGSGTILYGEPIPSGLSWASLSMANTPTWTADKTLKFTLPASFLQIEGFTPKPQDRSTVASTSFAFYLKVDAPPAATSMILSYYCDYYTKQIYGLQLDTDLTLNGFVHNGVGTPSAPLTLKKWTMIYVSFFNTYGNQGYSKIAIDGVVSAADTLIQNTQNPEACSTMSQVKFGQGFIGEIKRIQVFTPAALIPNSVPCNPTTCAVDIGFSSPPSCLEAVCNTPGTYTSFGSCESCPSKCLTCSDPVTCASCASGEYLDSNGNCVACSAPCVTCSDATTCESCNSGDILYLGNCITCPIHCSSCTSPSNCLTCAPGYGLYNNLCILCPVGTTLKGQICEKNSPLSNGVKETLEKTQLLTSAATQAANIISKGRSVSLSAMVAGRIFAMIKYLDIGYSDELQVALKTWLSSFVSLGLTPDMPNRIVERFENDKHEPMLFVFAKYKVSPSFLVNFWENLGIIVLVSGIWLILRIIEFFLKSNNKQSRAYSWTQTCQVHVQNFLFAVLYGVYGDLILYAILQYRIYDSGFSISVISVTVSVVFLFVMFIHITFHIRLLCQYQRIKTRFDDQNTLDEFIEKHKRSRVLFQDFKDYGLAPQLFIFFLSLKDMLFSLILTTMYKHPLIQAILSVLMTCLMFAYLLVKNPFESRFDAAQQYFFEFIGAVVNISVVFNAMLDTGDYIALASRKNVGKLIIVSNMVFNFITAFFMFNMIYQVLKDAYKSYKAKQSSKSSQKTFPQIQHRLDKSPPLNPRSSHQNTNNNLSEIQFLANGLDSELQTQDLSTFENHLTLPNSVHYQERQLLPRTMPMPMQSPPQAHRTRTHQNQIPPNLGNLGPMPKWVNRNGQRFSSPHQNQRSPQRARYRFNPNAGTISLFPQ